MGLVRTPSIRIASGLLAFAVAVIGCGTTATPSPSPAPTSSLVAALPGQTETDWGVIWDTLPADFPAYAGATPADGSAEGPASGTFVADGDVAADAATWFASGSVARVGGSADTEGPLEDGGYVVHTDGDGGCRIQVTASPIGGVTTITILYGGECPNP